MTRFVALSGLPRSGSTLCCHLVGAAPDAVALVEPMDVALLDPMDRCRAVSQVVEFFERSADSLRERGRAASVHRGGSLPDNPYGESRRADGLRERAVTEVGMVDFRKPLSEDFLLMIKHNAAFAALLPELFRHVEVFALTRNPLAVLCSWQTVPIPPQQGRALGAEHLDAELRRRLDAEPLVLERQIILLDWFFDRYSKHIAEGNQWRYEDVVATQGEALRRSLGLCATPSPSLMAERNANRAYRGIDVSRLAERLLRRPGAWSTFYPDDAISALAERLQAVE